MGSLIKLSKLLTVGCTIGNSYYIPKSFTSFELSIFWPSDTESRINYLKFYDSISLSYTSRLTFFTCFAALLLKVNFKQRIRDRKHDTVTLRNQT